MAKYSQTITVQCPRCGSGKVVKRGYHEGKQTFSCKTCARRFFESGETLDNRAQQVGAAVSMYYDGLSYKRIAENIAATFDRPEPSKRTIYQWVRNYTDKAIVAMREYPAQASTDLACLRRVAAPIMSTWAVPTPWQRVARRNHRRRVRASSRRE